MVMMLAGRSTGAVSDIGPHHLCAKVVLGGGVASIREGAMCPWYDANTISSSGGKDQQGKAS